MNLVVLKQPRVIPRQQTYQNAKRVFDLALCLISLPVVLPILAVCACAIYLNSPGPVFFIQGRIGKGGRRFRMYKFRTMKPDLEERQCREYMMAYVRGELDCSENGTEVFKPIHAHQITRVGRILRKTSLDELPQLINVFKGEMSIVGPGRMCPGKWKPTAPGTTSGWRSCRGSPAWPRCAAGAVSILCPWFVPISSISRSKVWRWILRSCGGLLLRLSLAKVRS